MNNKFIDTSIYRKKSNVKNNLTLFNNTQLFSIIEFNIHGSCNRSCSFCPVSNPEIYTKTKDCLEPTLFEKITLDLKSINYTGTILFSAFSEPLLHKDIETLIKTAKKNLPLCKVEIVSNGDTLNTKKLKSLFLSGLDILNISMYDGAHQIDLFDKMRDEANISKEKIILRRRYFEDGNFGITISNRSGLIDSNKFRDKREETIKNLPLVKKCYYPFYMILVDYNGDVLLCPHDWKKTLKFGNLKDKHIFDIWINKKFNLIRKKLSEKNRNFSPCNLCDVDGTLIGKEIFEQWYELNEK